MKKHYFKKKGITIYYRRIKKHSLKCYTAAAGKAKRELLKKGKLLVFDYSSAWQNTDAVIQGSGRIHDLFVQVIYGWLLKTALTQKSNTVLFYTECTSSTLEIMYLAHLRKTWKTLHSVSIEEWCKKWSLFF